MVAPSLLFLFRLDAPPFRCGPFSLESATAAAIGHGQTAAASPQLPNILVTSRGVGLVLLVLPLERALALDLVPHPPSPEVGVNLLAGTKVQYSPTIKTRR